ncbi:MAG: aldose 1-epimerase [Candidatus Limnocylindrales bacterium]
MTISLAAAGTSALVDPAAGGRLASLVVAGRERLVTEPQADATLPSITWGSFLLAPWVGRLANGRLDWRGRSAELPRNLDGHAIHGAVFDRPWEVDGQDAGSVQLSSSIAADRWPFRGRIRQEISLGERSIRFMAEIEAEEAMPAAIGWHPWFVRGPDDLALTVEADRRLELGPGLIPTGPSRQVAGADDLRAGPLLGERRLDDVYVDVASPARVRWPDLDLRLEFGPPLISVVVFSPPGSACLEPASAWPDAVRLARAGVTGTGLVELDAGTSLVASMTWRW